MLRFHCFVHCAPDGSSTSVPVSVQGKDILAVPISGPLTSLPVTFDHAASELSQIEGLHFELDGSFVWGRGAGSDRWQVNGQLTDGGDQLEFVELRGTCPEEVLDLLLQAFTHAQQSLLVQLVQEGVYVEVETMKQTCRFGAAPTEP